jgi:twitching motility protein PilT
MSGIELSEMTEDLVFDDRPAAKPKPANSAQSAPKPAAQPAVQPLPVVGAELNVEPLEPELELPAAKPSNQPVLAAKIRPATADHVPVEIAPATEISKPVAVELPPVSQPVTASGVVSPVAQAQVHQQSPQPAQPAQPSVQTQSPQPAQLAQPAAAVNQNTLSPVIKSPTESQNDRRVVRSDASSLHKKESIDLFETLIASAAKGGASDIILKCGQVPMFRWNGELFPSRNGPRLEKSFLETLCGAILSKIHCERLNDLHDVDFGYLSTRGGRVRVNVFRQTGEFGLVARLIPGEIPNFERLELDQRLKQFVEHKRGLVLVTGATGSGKSTTLAALLDYINNTRTSHIITIEDPVEFAHHDKRSVFNQRELGLDTRSFADALRSALRQAPDVILVGELRDAETTEIALQAAETGHLVLSTLHTNDAADSIIRILGMVGQEKESVVRVQLADSLRGVISQRLVKRADRNGRVAAQEVMVNTATIREKLLKGAHPSVVRDFISQGATYGMHTFDQHLIRLVKSGVVDYEEALNNATNRDDFALRFSGVGDGREAS